MVRVMTYRGAIRETLKEEMERDDRVVLVGEDIGTYGGVYKVTAGLLGEFGPSRVIDTPISEGSIVGMGLGMAIKGLKPVVELMFMDFLQLGMEEFVTEAAKARFLSAGKLSAPLVLRTP